MQVEVKGINKPKQLSNGKMSYGYLLSDNGSGAEGWANSYGKKYNVNVGDTVELEVSKSKQGNYWNIEDMYIAEGFEPVAPPTNVTKAPWTKAAPAANNDKQEIISRQFLMNFTVSLMTYAAKTGTDFESAFNYFKENFADAESFLYKTEVETVKEEAPVTTKEIAVDDADADLEAIVSKRKRK